MMPVLRTREVSGGLLAWQVAPQRRTQDSYLMKWYPGLLLLPQSLAGKCFDLFGVL